MFKMPMHLAPNKTVPVHRSLQVSQRPSTKFLYTFVEGGYVAKRAHFSKSTLDSVGNVV